MTVEYFKGLKSAFKYFRVPLFFRSISPSIFLDFTGLYKSSQTLTARKVHQNPSKNRFQDVSHFQSIFLRFWLHFGGLLGPLGASWGPLGGLLGASWGPLGGLLEASNLFYLKCAKIIALDSKNSQNHKPVRAGNGKRVSMWSMCDHV